MLLETEPSRWQAIKTYVAKWNWTIAQIFLLTVFVSLTGYAASTDKRLNYVGFPIIMVLLVITSILTTRKHIRDGVNSESPAVWFAFPWIGAGFVMMIYVGLIE